MFMSEDVSELFKEPSRPVHVLGLGGSTRPDSSSEQALKVALAAAERHGASVDLVAGRDLMLPIYDTEERTDNPVVHRVLDAVRKADALILSSPGYHGTMSGMLKNVLDYFEELRTDERVYLDGMPVGCVAVAYGWQATASTLASLRTTVHALRGWPTSMGAAVNASAPLFDAGGACVDKSALFQLEMVGQQVATFVPSQARPAIWSWRPLPVDEP